MPRSGFAVALVVGSCPAGRAVGMQQDQVCMATTCPALLRCRVLHIPTGLPPHCLSLPCSHVRHQENQRAFLFGQREEKK